MKVDVYIFKSMDCHVGSDIMNKSWNRETERERETCSYFVVSSILRTSQIKEIFAQTTDAVLHQAPGLHDVHTVYTTD